MRVVKPGKLGVLTRCYEHERRYYMGVSVLAFIPIGLAAPAPILLSEVDMWKFAAKQLGGGSLDVGIPKRRGEFLVIGKAYAPGGAARPRFSASAQVGASKKTVEVFGDRSWRGSTMTSPAPITEMPLDWAHAFGGPEFPHNPLGKGHAEVEVGGAKVRPLPNLESPLQRIGSPRDRPEPVGFGPIDITWPQRAALAGTYDQDWLENLMPGFARDIDWGLHNIAARDQQVEGFWTGEEAYRFDNMHPARVVAGALPKVRARAFISRSHAPGEPRASFAAVKKAARQPPAAIDEVELALQTLWFFPEAERAVLVWQGQVHVAEEDGADVVHLLVAGEHEGRAKPLEHYVTTLAARLDPEWGTLAALMDGELLPEDLALLPDQPPDEDEQLSQVEGLTQQNLHRRMVAESQKARDIVASYGLDPDVHGPEIPPPQPPPPKLHELPDLIARIQADCKKKQAEYEATYATKLAEAERDADAANIPGFDGKSLRAEIDAKQVGPPTFTAAAMHASLVAIAVDCRRRDTIVDEIEDMIVDKALYAQWQETEHNMRESYRLVAHVQHPAPAMAPEWREPTRERLRLALEQKEDLSTLNFTGADLAGMDLRGADLTGGLFESANLTGADLRGCKLTRVVLAHADLTDARLDGACLQRVNLGKARLTRTVLADADLRDAILTEARLDGADLQRACATGATWMGAHLCSVDARGLVGEKLNFLEMTIVSADFSGARLTGSSFIKLRLRGARFARAALQSCTFLECDAEGVEFAGANLEQSRFVGGCALDRAELAGATLKRANLRGTSLAAANLREALLDGADLSECDLAGARLYQASAREARFEVADLRGAELLAANLMGASLARAALYGADLRGANLHGADMARVRTDDRLRLDQALMTKVRVHPKHVEQPREERRR
ncbi:DUF2169 family type VI secretion system accessory protein [Nannocystis pusilla]|uniref:DUF2169 domain-containing protein n=1 Tax=Nannocystis pusilla TaxID=889268 RepID=A0ABS7TR02_9BACT|nr:DUF2169 domain-containing protein [Nannocystis pusilla]MBZ5710476.1 DUF2169 domain-containing protein [Nannocystis pusilla]